MTKRGRFRFAGKEYELSALPIANGLTVESVQEYGEALEALGRAANSRELVAATASAAKSLGFDSFTYGCLVPRITSYPLMVVFTTLSQEWMVEYHRRGYADKDPRIAHCLVSSEALCWSADDYRGQPELGEMLADMEKEGLAAAIVYPLRFHMQHMECAGMLSLNSKEAGFWKKRRARKLDIVGKGHILASAVNKRLLDLGVLSQQSPLAGEPHPELLTPREREILQLMWHGDTDRSVARQLRIEHTTVRRHIDSIKAKLCAGSKAEMLAIARQMGLCGTSLAAFIEGKKFPS